MQMETVVSALQTLTRWTFGQYCGLARAMEMIGERWAILLVRDLMTGPRTVVQLQEGFPQMPPGLLSSRLAELERSGVIRVQAHASDGTRYELTEYGLALEEIVLALGRWGAASLAAVRPEDVVTPESIIMALRATFVRNAAAGVRFSFELRVGEIILHGKVNDGALDVGKGSLPEVDLIIEPGTILKDLMTGVVTAEQALAHPTFRAIGNPALVAVFAKVFHLPSLPIQQRDTR
jgi:DNA-binding HxlR family transcriptional regulator